MTQHTGMMLTWRSSGAVTSHLSAGPSVSYALLCTKYYEQCCILMSDLTTPHRGMPPLMRSRQSSHIGSSIKGSLARHHSRTAVSRISLLPRDSPSESHQRELQ